MASDENQALSRSEFWDERYAKSDGEAPTHEWFRSFSDLQPFFEKNLFATPGVTARDDPLILHLGSGDSEIPVEFATRGYRRQICADFSTVVVQLMKERHSKVEGIEWRQLDVRNMSGIENKSVDVAFDKGTLDAMIFGSPWTPPDEVKENTSKYLREVHRVLKDDGIFLYITYRQPHFIQPLLNQDKLWKLDMQKLGGVGFLDYCAFVIRKADEIEF